MVSLYLNILIMSNKFVLFNENNSCENYSIKYNFEYHTRTTNYNSFCSNDF